MIYYYGEETAKQFGMLLCKMLDVNEQARISCHQALDDLFLGGECSELINGEILMIAITFLFLHTDLCDRDDKLKQQLGVSSRPPSPVQSPTQTAAALRGFNLTPQFQQQLQSNLSSQAQHNPGKIKHVHTVNHLFSFVGCTSILARILSYIFLLLF